MMRRMKPERDPDRPDLAALAKRFMDLWQEQMNAVAGDPALAESIGRFMASMPPGMPFWPGRHDAKGGAKAPGSASDERGRGVDQLASRLDAIEKRLARLEGGTRAKRGGAASKSRKRKA
jgi:hypothetical protein